MQVHLAVHDDDMWCVITDGPIKILKTNTVIAISKDALQLVGKHRSEWTTEYKTNLDNVRG